MCRGVFSLILLSNSLASTVCDVHIISLLQCVIQVLVILSAKCLTLKSKAGDQGNLLKKKSQFTAALN